MKSWESHFGLGSKLSRSDAASSMLGFSDGGVDGLMVLAGVLAVVFVVVPLLLFGIELIILGLVLALGIVGRSLFGKPWTVAAARPGDREPVALWRVRGWRQSARLIDRICVDLEARGQLPSDVP